TVAPLRRFKAGDPELVAARKVADRDQFERYEGGDLYFALGKMYDDAGEIDEAFRAFTTANGWSNSLYDRKETEKTYNELVSSYSEPLLRQRRDHGFNSKVPILVVGMPRSGTTLVESILASNPAVATVGEGSFLDRCGMLLGEFAPRVEDL